MVKNYKILVMLVLVDYFLITNAECVLKNTVHVFGDSHSSFLYSYTNQGRLQHEKLLYPLNINANPCLLPVVIHWVGPVTMHHVGIQGIPYNEVKDNDIVVFVFGEIDVRCHIGRQRDFFDRPLAEVIETLVVNYVKFLATLRSQFNNLVCVISSVVPPTNTGFNSKFPYHGTLCDRVVITRQLNEALRTAAIKNNFLYLDNYSMYCTSLGALSLDVSELQNVHVLKSEPSKQKLIELVLGVDRLTNT